MGSFGTTEDTVYNANGERVKTEGKVEEICSTCQFSATGPHNFEITREDLRTTELLCPNCGDRVTRFSSQVQKLDEGASQPR